MNNILEQNFVGVGHIRHGMLWNSSAHHVCYRMSKRVFRSHETLWYVLLKKKDAQVYFGILQNIAYMGWVVDCMLCVRAPCVQYASVQELVCLFVGVLDAYNRKIDEVLRDIWDERKNKRWSGYDRLMLGIFCFDEVILSTVEIIHLSTKKRGAIYACVVHREICKLLNEANRNYIHSTEVPDRNELVRLLQRVSTEAVLMGGNSLMMCVMRQNVLRCTDIHGDAWLLCPRHMLPAYIVALYMSQHRRLGMSSELFAMPIDIMRHLVNFLFATTSWDSNPLDSKVKVGVPV
jgi:hypothetical protein